MTFVIIKTSIVSLVVNRSVLPSSASLAGFQASVPLTSSGLTDPPAQHHELPPPAPVRQQLRGQSPQRLHDGSAEADPSRFIHLLSCLPGHREAAAPEHPDSDPGLRPGPGRRPDSWPDSSPDFRRRELPQLLLQRGEERPDGPERRCRCTCQGGRGSCRGGLNRKQSAT